MADTQTLPMTEPAELDRSEWSQPTSHDDLGGVYLRRRQQESELAAGLTAGLALFLRTGGSGSGEGPVGTAGEPTQSAGESAKPNEGFQYPEPMQASMIPDLRPLLGEAVAGARSAVGAARGALHKGAHAFERGKELGKEFIDKSLAVRDQMGLGEEGGAEVTPGEGAPVGEHGEGEQSKAPLWKRVYESNERAGLEGYQGMSHMGSAVADFISEQFEQQFPRDEWKGNLGVDAARGVITGLGGLLRVVGDPASTYVGLTAQGGADILRLGLQALNVWGLLRSSGVPEWKVKSMQKSLDLVGGYVVPLHLPAVRGTEKAMEEAQAALPALKPFRQMPFKFDEGRLLTLADAVAQKTAQNGGATIHPVLGDLAGTGRGMTAVALYSDVPSLTQVIPGKLRDPKVVEAFLRRPDVQRYLQDGKHSVGTWFNEATNSTELTVVPTLPRKLAERAGREANQISVFDLDAMKEIPTGGTGAPVPLPPPETRLNLLLNAEKQRTVLATVLQNELAVIQHLARPTKDELREAETTDTISRMRQRINDFEKKLEDAGITKGEPPSVKNDQTGAVGFRGPLVPPDSSRLFDLFKIGKELGGKVWYLGFNDTLTKAFGADADLVARLIAATSPLRPAQGFTDKGTFLSNSNIETARKIYEAFKTGGLKAVEDITLPGGGAGVPQRENVLNVIKGVLNGDKDISVIGDRKTQEFYRCLMGATDCVVLDSWMYRILYPQKAAARIAKAKGTGKPAQLSFTSAEYTASEQVIRDFAKQLGVTTNELQAALWAAMRVEVKGEAKALLGNQSFKQTLNDILAHHNYPGFVKGQSGVSADAVTFGLARIMIGAVIGEYTGDTPEERVRNAMIGAGVGALASPALVKAIANGIREDGAAFLPNRMVVPKQEGEFKFGLGTKEYTGASPLRRPTEAEIKRMPPRLAARYANPSQESSLAENQVNRLGSYRLGEASQPKKMSAADILRSQRGGSEPPPYEPVEIPPGAAEHFAALDPNTVVLGDKGLRINWSQLVNDPSAIDDVLKKIVSMRGEHIDEARRGVITDARVKELAQMIGVSVEDVLSRPVGKALNAEELQAVTDLVGAHMKKLHEVNEMYRATTGAEKEAAKTALQTQLALTERLVEQFYGARAEWGRAGRVFQGAAQPIQETNQLRQITDLQSRGLIRNVDRVSDFLTSLETPKQQMSFLRQVIHGAHQGAQSIGDLMMSSWVNAMLLSFQGNMANIFSNTTTMVLAPWERFVAGGIASARFANDADRVFMGEGTAMIQGALSGYADALITAARTLKTGQPAFGTAKIVPKTAEALADTGLVGRAVDSLSTIVELPGRFLMAADDFSKVINKRMELAAQAYREGARQGLKGKDFAQFVEDFKNDPPPHAIQIAEDFANYQTFTKPLEGRLASMQNALSHPLAKLVVPFFRTPMNIFTYTFERFPVLGMAVKQEREDMMAGGARRDLALARMSTGAMVLGLYTSLAMAGRISGRGPTDPNAVAALRQTDEKWQPYSIKIGDKWYGDYMRVLGPLGLMLGFTSDFATIAQELPADEAHELAAAGTVAFGRTMLSQTFLDGLSKFTTGIMANQPKDINDRFIKDLAATLPGMVPVVGQLMVAPATNQVRQYMDPVIRDTFSVLDRVFERIPGFSPGFNARKNLFAEPIAIHPGVPEVLGFITPVRVGTPQDPTPQGRIYQEIVENRASIEPPAKVIFGSTPPRFGDVPAKSGIPLTAKQYDRYVDLAGKEIKVNGKNLEATLSEFIKSPAYDALADGPEGKGRELANIVLKYREAARAQLIHEYPELEAALVELKINRARARVKASGDTNAVPQVTGR